MNWRGQFKIPYCPIQIQIAFSISNIACEGANLKNKKCLYSETQMILSAWGTIYKVHCYRADKRTRLTQDEPPKHSYLQN